MGAGADAMSAVGAGESVPRDPLCYWGDNPSLPCDYPHLGMVLCDDDGVVRGGGMHDGTDYPCTGHAHFGGHHILCTSPAHPEAAHRVVTAQYATASAEYEAAAMSGDPERLQVVHVEITAPLLALLPYEPSGEQVRDFGPPTDRVLRLIDTELVRLGDAATAEPLEWWQFRQKRWRDGVLVAREYAAMHLREIRDAYVADALTRESEALGLYDSASFSGSSASEQGEPHG